MHSACASRNRRRLAAANASYVPPSGKITAADRYLKTMSNALQTGLMEPDEWLDELAEILAAGLMRLRARKSSALFGHGGESCLDFSPHQRGHAPTGEREARE